MAISCFTNYIGLLDVTSNPTSGRYVNELAGIDTPQFELIKKDEVYDVETAWQDIERRAIKKFEHKLNVWGVKYFRNFNYISNEITGQYIDNTSVPTSSYYQGLYFSDFISTQKNMSAVLQFVDLYSDASVVSSIKIFNAATGDVLDTITHTFEADKINRIVINKHYPLWKYPKLFIAYDSRDIGSLKATDLITINNGGNLSQMKVPTSSTPISTNLVSVGSTGQGMILSYSISCGWDNFVCQRIQLFEEAYLYCLGTEYFTERLYTDRMSQYSLLDTEKTTQLRDEYSNTFNEMIDSTLKSIPVDFGANDFCFACDRAVQWRVMLP